MNETTLLARVHAHLDARRDPFDDGEVVAFLDAHPESLAVVAALRADARSLAAVPVPVTRRRRWPIAVAAAALLAAAGAAVTVLTSHRGPGASAGAGAGAGRILAASLEEIRPRAHAAAAIVVVEPLAHFATARLETWQLRSEPR